MVSDFSSEKRIFIPFNAIPKKVINAFLSAEDKNFFSHPGVDAKGIVRAVINNISKKCEFADIVDYKEYKKIKKLNSNVDNVLYAPVTEYDYYELILNKPLTIIAVVNIQKLINPIPIPS